MKEGWWINMFNITNDMFCNFFPRYLMDFEINGFFSRTDAAWVHIAFSYGYL